MIEFTQIGLFAETHIHVGEGQNRGAIDLPVARGGHDGLPFIPGSSIKGALRADFNHDPKIRDEIFGPETNPPAETGAAEEAQQGAGAAIFTDAQLVLLPVRSNVKPFYYVTCPILLRRLSTHFEACGKEPLTVNSPGELEAWGSVKPDSLFLEDLRIDVKKNDSVSNVAAAIEHLTDQSIPADSIIIASDRIFRWLATHALPVRARNKLNENKAVDGSALWYEETLPPETLLSCLWGKRKDLCAKVGGTDDPVAYLLGKLIPSQATAGFLQVGGNETVGQGWFRLKEVCS